MPDKRKYSETQDTWFNSTFLVTSDWLQSFRVPPKMRRRFTSTAIGTECERVIICEGA